MYMSTPHTFSFVTLETPRLTLREFAEGDAKAIQVYAGDPEVTRFTSWGPNTPETTEAVLASWVLDQNASPRTEYTLAIVRKEDGILIGGAGFGMTDWNIAGRQTSATSSGDPLGAKVTLRRRVVQSWISP